MSETEVWSVSELTYEIKDILESNFEWVGVQGEISNYRPAASGHLYFSLKDEEANISAVLFRGTAARHRSLLLKNGLEVICYGKLSLYPPRGNYQIIIEKISAVGAGGLQAKFEALKKKLLAEGLFNEAIKKPLPKMPAKIAVITSPTGAAIQDVISVVKRRAPNVKLLIVPSLVQGDGAEKELIKALKLVNKYNLADVVLLTRGGGSLEDLWCFNSEKLAREINASNIPVVSAVGHEIDFTIADFVADLRAPTPSAAAEILVSEQEQMNERVLDCKLRLISMIRNTFKNNQLLLQSIVSRMRSPKDRVNDLQLRFDDWMERLQQAMQQYLVSKKNILERFNTERIVLCMQNRMQKAQRRLELMESSIQALSPLNVLDRGYSIVYTEDGKVLKASAQAKSGMKINVQLSKGSIDAEVTKSQE